MKKIQSKTNQENKTFKILQKSHLLLGILLHLKLVLNLVSKDKSNSFQLIQYSDEVWIPLSHSQGKPTSRKFI